MSILDICKQGLGELSGIVAAAGCGFLYVSDRFDEDIAMDQTWQKWRVIQDCWLSRWKRLLERDNSYRTALIWNLLMLAVGWMCGLGQEGEVHA